MKVLSLALFLVSFQIFASEALTTNSMDDVFAKVAEKSQIYGRENVLVVFDIDNTILTAVNDLGSDQWYSWQEQVMKDPGCLPVCVSTNMDELIKAQGLLFNLGKMKPTEASLPKKLKELQAAGTKVILLTSRGPDFRSLTETSLRENAMSFEDSTLNRSIDQTSTYLPYDISNLSASGLTDGDASLASLGQARTVSFQNGIYMTAGQNKGVMLKVLLNRYRLNYKAVIFADDHVRHVTRMQAIMGHLSDVTTYRYAGMDPEVERFNRMDKTEVIEQWSKLQKTIKEIGF